jgi:hypothetical protein
MWGIGKGAVKRPLLWGAAQSVTTDFFGFDTSNNHFKLQGLGDVSEMGDAVLGFVASEMAERAPRGLAIRNVSDPQIKADGLTLKQQAAIAAQIYKGFWPVEFGLQRDYLLGQHCGGVEQPNNDTRHNVIMSFKCSGASRLPATAARGKWQSRGESGDVAEFDRNEERLEERPVERPDIRRALVTTSARM